LYMKMIYGTGTVRYGTEFWGSWAQAQNTYESCAQNPDKFRELIMKMIPVHRFEAL
jgi:hypothetical protein